MNGVWLKVHTCSCSRYLKYFDINITFNRGLIVIGHSVHKTRPSRSKCVWYFANTVYFFLLSTVLQRKFPVRKMQEGGYEPNLSQIRSDFDMEWLSQYQSFKMYYFQSCIISVLIYIVIVNRYCWLFIGVMI